MAATMMNATSTFSCPHNGTAHDGTLLCHWTNSPGARGTLNIFWLCISTLGLCVWNAVHPDVPRPKTPGWRVFGKRVWWLCVGLFMPGMLVLVALGNFRQACQILVDVDKETAAPTEFPWWMHLFKVWRPKRRNYADEDKLWMRAMLWCLRIPPARLPGEPQFDPNEVKTEAPQQSVPTAEPSVAVGYVETAAPDWGADVSIDTPQRWSYSSHLSSAPQEYGPPTLGIERMNFWTLTHSFYALMGGFVNDNGDAIDIDDVSRLIARPSTDPGRMPDIPVHNIRDRGESSTQAKLLLVWQLFVFLANCFVRFNQSLPLSLLEIITVSHVLSTTLVMMLWWYKPHNIWEPTVIVQSGPLPLPATVTWRNLFSSRALRALYLATPSVEQGVDVPQIILLVAAAILYGLPHLLGLSIHFPTFAEQLCWHISTYTVIGSPLIMCVIVWISPYTYMLRLEGMRDAVYMLLQSLLIILFLLYTIASMFLVGESVRQIFALPVESFREAQLASYLPNFS